jgi:hypothetical protein
MSRGDDNEQIPNPSNNLQSKPDSCQSQTSYIDFSTLIPIKNPLVDAHHSSCGGKIKGGGYGSLPYCSGPMKSQAA